MTTSRSSDGGASTPHDALFEHKLDGRTEALLALVGTGLEKAQRKFAPFNSPHEGWAVIREEMDELWEHVKANDGEDGEAFWEAIQVAAMALRYAYDLSAWKFTTTPTVPLVDLDMGGWGGTITVQPPVRMLVDYVKVWALA